MDVKAVVMEIKDGYAAVLTQDSRFIKIKDKNYQIGMEINLEERASKILSINLNSFKRILVPCLSLASLIFVMIGIKDFYTPYSIISLDVNPSIEISANRYDIVLSVEAINEDGQEIVDEINSNKSQFDSVETIVEIVLDEFTNSNYEAEDGMTYVVISANSKKEKHSQKIINKIEAIEEKHEDISSTTIVADDELVERSRQEGTTAGKLYLVESLKEIKPDEEINESEWLEKPVKDIVKEIESTKIDLSELDPQEINEEIEKPTNNSSITNQNIEIENKEENNQTNPTKEKIETPSKENISEEKTSELEKSEKQEKDDSQEKEKTAPEDSGNLPKKDPPSK